RIDQGRGDAGDVVGLVGVARVRIGQFELVVDAVEAGRDTGGHHEIRVDVGPGDSGFDPAPRPLPDDPEAAGAVVLTPHDARGGPAPRYVTPVGVQGRGG